MDIHPQLACVIPEDAAALVQELCLMAPGISWSSQILDDVLSTLGNRIICSRIEFTPPVGGLTKICTHLLKKDVEKKQNKAMVVYYCLSEAEFPYEIP